MDGIDVILRDFGFPMAALVALAITGIRGDWIFGREYRAMRHERDEWKAIALSALNVAEHVAKR